MHNFCNKLAYAKFGSEGTKLNRASHLELQVLPTSVRQHCTVLLDALFAWHPLSAMVEENYDIWHRRLP